MRGKTLEALAMARPVVTTSVGAEGLGAISGRHLLIANGAADFAAAVRRLLDDPALAGRLGAAGRALVEARFDWDAISAAHDDIYAQVIAEGRAPRPGSRLDLPAGLSALGGRLGYLPAVGLGFGILAIRGAHWHLRALTARRRPPFVRTRLEGQRAA